MTFTFGLFIYTEHLTLTTYKYYYGLQTMVLQPTFQFLSDNCYVSNIYTPTNQWPCKFPYWPVIIFLIVNACNVRDMLELFSRHLMLAQVLSTKTALHHILAYKILVASEDIWMLSLWITLLCRSFLLSGFSFNCILLFLCYHDLLMSRAHWSQAEW